MPLDVPDRIIELLEKFRARVINESEKEELVDWAAGQDLSQLKGFLVATEGWSQTHVNRLFKEIQKRMEEIKAANVGEAVQKSIEKGAIDWAKKWGSELANEITAAGTAAVTKLYNIAVEMGYMDPKTGRVDIVKFIMDAANFYAQNRHKVQQYIEDMENLKAIGSILVALTKPYIQAQLALKMYFDFITQVNQVLAMTGPENVNWPLVRDAKFVVTSFLNQLGQRSLAAKILGVKP